MEPMKALIVLSLMIIIGNVIGNAIWYFIRKLIDK